MKDLNFVRVGTRRVPLTDIYNGTCDYELVRGGRLQITQ